MGSEQCIQRPNSRTPQGTRRPAGHPAKSGLEYHVGRFHGPPLSLMICGIRGVQRLDHCSAHHIRAAESTKGALCDTLSQSMPASRVDGSACECETCVHERIEREHRPNGDGKRESEWRHHGQSVDQRQRANRLIQLAKLQPRYDTLTFPDNKSGDNTVCSGAICAGNRKGA